MAWILGIAWGGMCASPFVTRGRRAGVGCADQPAPWRSRAGAGARVAHDVSLGLDRLRSLGLPRMGAGTRRLGAARRAFVHDPTVRERRGSRARSRASCRRRPARRRGRGRLHAVSRGRGRGALGPAALRPMRSRLVLRACALGTGFESALEDAAADVARAPRDWSTRCSRPIDSVPRSAPQLARLADEERAALRRRAETHARRVPVKLLFPLVFLVLPAFVLLTVVPGLVAGLQRL